MPITERRTLASINHNRIANTLEVKWCDEILRDDEIILSVPHRCVYEMSQRDQFIADVGDTVAAPYLVAAGW